MVTVVFCDLVGSTALSGHLDPEALRAVVLQYFALMREQIEAHGGTVEKFIGDAVMAVFGVPAMHEDDARRALNAALRMVDALEELNRRLATGSGVRLDVRIGVNTGEVVATGDSSARQALVSGEVVNVAARLEQHAPTGGVLLGPGTLGAAGPAAVVRAVGPLALKGKEQPVEAFRLITVRDDEPERLRRFDLPFVGREDERTELNLHFRSTAGQRRARLTTVFGDAGIGKTRLVRTWLDGLPAARRGTGRCRPYGAVGSLAPLADALHGLLPGEGPDPFAALPAADREEAASALAVLREGLLRDGTPGPSPSATAAAVCCLLTLLAEESPVVLVLDDCQWATDALLELLERLPQEAEHAAVLVVCVARPELLERHPGWGSGRLRSSSLLLAGLSAAESERFAAGLEEVVAHSTSVHETVLDRAGGNPLHLEQLLMSLSESGTAAPDRLPPTLQALLGARVDALDAPDRTVLDVAAVLGREFRSADVRDLVSRGDTGVGEAAVPAVDEVLRHLVVRRLLEPQGRATAGGMPASLRFAGALVHEVAYRSTAKRLRADRHAHAAELLAARGEADAGVGDHYARAHGYRVDLSLHDARTEDLRARAVARLAAAGTAALARCDLPWAGELLGRARRLSTPADAAHAGVLRRLGEVRLAHGDSGTGGELLREALREAREAGEAGRVEAAHARLALSLTDPDGAGGGPAEAARAALPVFEAARDGAGLARATTRLAQEAQSRGRHAEAGTLLSRALEQAARAGAEPERALAAGATGVSLWRGPDPVPQAVAVCRDLRAAHGEGRPAVRLTLGCPLAVLLALDDDFTGAADTLAENRRLARGLGYAETEAVLPLFAAETASLAGDFVRAAALLADAERACRDLGDPALLRTVVQEGVRAALDAGECPGTPPPDAGEGIALSAAESAGRDGLLARTAARGRRRDEALALAARAVRAAARTDSPVVRATAALDAAYACRTLEDPGYAEYARLAWDDFAAKGHKPGLRRAGRLMDRPESGAATGRPW